MSDYMKIETEADFLVKTWVENATLSCIEATFLEKIFISDPADLVETGQDQTIESEVAISPLMRYSPLLFEIAAMCDEYEIEEVHGMSKSLKDNTKTLAADYLRRELEGSVIAANEWIQNEFYDLQEACESSLAADYLEEVKMVLAVEKWTKQTNEPYEYGIDGFCEWKMRQLIQRHDREIEELKKDLTDWLNLVFDEWHETKLDDVEIEDYMHESVDGCQYLIYTYKQRLVCVLANDFDTEEAHAISKDWDSHATACAYLYLRNELADKLY